MARLPSRLSLPYVAALLGVLAPLGFPFLRWTGEGPWWDELLSHRLAYAYFLFCGPVAFVALGVILGRREDELADRTARDGLTGLFNRRHFDLRLEEETARAARYGTPVALILVDLDEFKSINDRQGHDGGDRNLRAAAGVLRSVCRSTDLVARYGGDEFAVITPSTTARDALALAERIRAALKAGRDGVGCTASIGVTDVERAGVASPRGLIVSTDAALYRAKALGRDRVVLADDLSVTRPRTPTSTPTTRGRPRRPETTLAA